MAEPWRVLILDSDPADPKWVLATVASPNDVRPAQPGTTGIDDVTLAWAGLLTGDPHLAVTPMPAAQCWRIERTQR